MAVGSPVNARAAVAYWVVQKSGTPVLIFEKLP